MDSICPHSIAGSVGVNVKGFIVIWVGKEAISCHKCFHMLEGKVNNGCPRKHFLSRFTEERSKGVGTIWPHLIVVGDSTKEAIHLG